MAIPGQLTVSSSSSIDTPLPAIAPPGDRLVPAPSSKRIFSIQIGWTLATRLLMTANSVAAGVVVARWLGAEGLGALAVINVAVATMIQIGGAGLPSASTYFISRDRSLLRRAAASSLLFSLIAGTALAFCIGVVSLKAPQFFGRISPSVICVAAISIPFQLMTLVALNIFLAIGRVDRFNWLDLLGQSFVLINSVIVLVVLRSGLGLLVGFNTSASILVCLIVLLMVVRAWSGGGAEPEAALDLHLFGRMVRYGLKFHVATVAGLLIFRADMLVVNHFRGTAEAGIYAVASQMAMMLMLLPAVIATLLFPRVSAVDDPKGELTCLITRHTAFVMMIICTAAAPAAFLLPVLYGARFNGAVVQLLILLPGVYLIGVESVLVQHFSGIGLPKAVPLFWLITLVFNLCLTFTLVPPLGANGAAIASSLTYALIFVLIAFYFRRFTRRRLSEALILRGLELRALLNFANHSGASGRMG